ncbi:MAG: TRIC cation channel family protein, partial [Oscillospiraceae bacterium]|nr:TRIC cation channel family protein [Oscillospiraceae bacterium]
METLIFVLEVIGTLSFAVSGAFTAIRKDMDMFGVAILGLTTAVGGGIVRD